MTAEQRDVSGPARANKTEQTGGLGNRNAGKSTVAGLNEVEDSAEHMAEGVAPEEEPPVYDSHPLEGRQTEAVDQAEEAPPA